MADKLKSMSKAHTRYKLADGTTVPSVTTVCGLLNKPALVKWANNLGLQGIDSTKYVDEAATIGTLIHYMVECYVKAKIENVPYVEPTLDDYSKEQIDLAKNGFIKFLDWEKEHNVVYLKSELVMVSEKHKYGGTLDCLAIVDGELQIIDFKSGKGIFNEHFLQVSAYKELAEELGYKPKKIRILNIGRNENENFKEEVIDEVTSNKYFNIYTNLLVIHRVMKELGWN